MARIEDFYSGLLELLNQEGAATVITAYSQGGAVTRRLLGMRDDDALAELARLEELPEAVRKGPVTLIDRSQKETSNAADAQLTVIERYTTKPRMIILGAGHIAAQLAPLARRADFDVVIYDDRASFANSENFPDASEIICDGFPRLFERVKLRMTDYVVIVTRGHKHDADCLRGILSGVEPAYTGMIGSKRRVAIVMDVLRGEGYDADRIARIKSPIGLKIGAITPFEIAVSIISEVISVKRKELGSGDLATCDLAIAEHLANSGSNYDAMITIVNSEGSVPIDCGAKLAMTYAGRTHGTIGGGCSEAEAMQIARELINSGDRWRQHNVDMTDNAEEDGMVCGGMLRVVIEANRER